MMGQSAMFFMLILDFLFAIIIPLRHRMFTNLHYVFYMCIPPFLFAFVTVIFCFFFMNDDLIDFCTPAQTFPRKIAFISYVVNGTNIATLMLLLSVFVAVRKSQAGAICLL
ncbi:unnamed protein product [Angiostrongylus costaricensis]|uniref:G_PROTEIN_RECEP_F1_2 domain-containing protein n=1 Tax=Angiostrongylus costaricensis TaxID=334426 RepID=A0A0R3PPS7_ANGCS|nr:unnamed protein product [Angiostrongylus costaricensis]